MGVVLVRVPSLLERAATIQEESLACYIYDTTVFNTGGSTDLLGAAEYAVNHLPDGTVKTDIVYPEEIEIEDVRKAHDKDYTYEETIRIAHGTWKVLVVPVDNRFDPSTRFLILVEP